MVDREVIISHLDDLRLFADITVHPVVSPDNWDVYSSLCDYIDQIKTEVEILLKKQEPKTVIYAVETFEGVEIGRCPHCNSSLKNRRSCPVRFCQYCGQAVKWDEI